MARRYLIETFGCQMNFHDSERMAGLLEAAGYEPAQTPAEADVIVLNTCTVREKAEDKVYSRIGETRAQDARREGRQPVLAVTGCLAQQEGAVIFRRSPFVDVVVGTQAEKRLPMLVDEAGANPGAARSTSTRTTTCRFPSGWRRRARPGQGLRDDHRGLQRLLRVLRGAVHPRPRADAAEGRHPGRGGGGGRERADARSSCSDRSSTTTRRRTIPRATSPGCSRPSTPFPGCERIRFASPHPRHVTPRLIEAMRDLPHVCKHIHLPVQSGSTRMLAAMRRRHTREEYLDLVEAAEGRGAGNPAFDRYDRRVPRGDRRRTSRRRSRWCEAVGFHSMFSFKYSERPNTLAAKRLADDVPEEEKTRRLTALQERQSEIQRRCTQQAVGRTVEVLVDSVSRRRETELSGRTTGNTVVNFPGDPSAAGRAGEVRDRARRGAQPLGEGRVLDRSAGGPYLVERT